MDRPTAYSIVCEFVKDPGLRRHMVAPGRRGRVVQPRFGSHHPLPTQGIDDPFALAIGKLTTTNAPTGLVESRMRGQPARPVREGGMKKRAGSNPDTPPQADSAGNLRTPGQTPRL